MPVINPVTIKVAVLLMGTLFVITPTGVIKEPEKTYLVEFTNCYNEECMIIDKGNSLREIRENFEKSMPESRIQEINQVTE